MNKQCTGCVVSAGTHKPAEALHQIDEPQADAIRGNTAGGVRCHDADACAMGQLPCPTPKACGCAAARQAVQAAEPQPPEAAPVRKPLTDEEIEAATGAKQGTPLFLAAKGFTIAIERAHGIKE